MRTRLLLTLGSIAALVLGGFIALQLLSQLPGVTRSNFDRIRERATLKEIEGILGQDFRAWGRGGAVWETGVARVWYEDPLIITVWFDKHGKVEDKNLRVVETTAVETNFWVRLRKRLGL